MIHHLQGFVLKKIFLSNDDGLVELLTDGMGKITLKCPKLARSRKRLSHFDFFRLLELQVEERREHFRLKEVDTQIFWSHFTSHYELNKRGFSWLSLISKKLPEQKSMPILFEEILTTFIHARGESVEQSEAFLRFKLLQIPYSLPRFDQVRSDTYFCPQQLCFSAQPSPDFIPLTNITRQILEFIRRSHSHDFFAKLERLPHKNFKEVLDIIQSIEAYHA